MITAIVQYRLPSSIDLKACAEHFRKFAPGFRTVPGLIRKQFIYAEDGWAGGVYLWKTRADAEAFYSGPWLAGIRERYGMDPQIKYFQTACVTDNLAEAMLLPDKSKASFQCHAQRTSEILDPIPWSPQMPIDTLKEMQKYYVEFKG